MKHLSSLNTYFWKYRWRFCLGILFVIATNYFRILSPQLTGHIVNSVINNLKGRTINSATGNYDWLVQQIITFFHQFSFRQQVLLAGVVLILIAIVSGLFMFLMRQTIIVMSRMIEYDQKNLIFKHYQQLDMGFYKVQSTGDLMNRISEDVSRVRMYTGPAIMYFINLAAVIGFSIYFMLKSDVTLTVVALSPLPLLALTIYVVNTIIHKKSEQIQGQLSLLTTNAQESFSGIRVIKSFVQEKAMLSFFQSNSEAYRESSLRLAKTEAIYFPGIALLIGISTLATVMVGGLAVANHLPGASVGKIAEFVMYIQMLSFPVSAIGWTASMMQRAAVSQKRINEFLHTVPSINNQPDAATIHLKGNIHFNQVSFTYSHTGIKALNNVTFTIKQGQKIAVVGKTGSGKSTLAQLILRMYDATEGTVILEQIPIKNLAIEPLRQQISYVPQDVFLFSDSIRNNISFGNAANNQAVIKAAQTACIHDEIMRFPNQYDTQVGERGVTLSGGQKQRIAIARALINEPELIIFDDCLSAVDNKTEKTILNHLNQYIADKTAIIITHRLFPMLQFDAILVMDKGSIVETGTHEELLKKGGFYADLYHKQQSDLKN